VVLYGRATDQVQEFSYKIKATNAGTYVIPAAFGESMYDSKIRWPFSRRSHGCRTPVNRRAWRISAFGIVAIAAAGLVLRLAPHRPLSSYAPSSTAVYAEHGELLRLTLASDDQFRLWTPLSQVSPDT